MNVRTKFEVRIALPVPGIIGGGVLSKFGQSLDWTRPYSIFSKILMGFCSDGPVNVPARFEVRIALPVPEIIAIGVLDGGCEPPNAPILGKRRP